MSSTTQENITMWNNNFCWTSKTLIRIFLASLSFSLYPSFSLIYSNPRKRFKSIKQVPCKTRHLTSVITIYRQYPGTKSIARWILLQNQAAIKREIARSSGRLCRSCSASRFRDDRNVTAGIIAVGLVARCWFSDRTVRGQSVSINCWGRARPDAADFPQPWLAAAPSGFLDDCFRC